MWPLMTTLTLSHPQSQLGVFEFGHPETQEDCAFFCDIKPLEKELSSEAPEFYPNHLTEASELSESSDRIESLCEESFNELITKESTQYLNSDFEQSNNDLLSSDSETEFDSCLEILTELSNVKTVVHESDEEPDSAFSQVIEFDIIAQPSVR